MSRLVAFLGPSLPAVDVRALAGPVTIRPPAARGDVWRALAERPRAIALIDGVFEAQPSVWPREILEALEAGVAVFGGASMGALRACELGPFGMVGVGQIFRWYRDGVLIDDAEVALLHADAAHGHRPLTVPLVNVRWAAQRAREAGVLRQREATELVSAAAAVYYQERRWPVVFERVGWPRSKHERFERFLTAQRPDLKADDARACLAAAAGFARGVRLARPGPLRWPAPSMLARRRLGEQAVVAGKDDSLLAGLARELGLRAGPRELARARRTCARQRGCRLSRLDAELAREGLNPLEAARVLEDLALAELVRGRASLLF